MGSLLAQRQIEDPAAMCMVSRLATMLKDLRVLAAAVFERVSQEG
jgi:hypothetical protein